MDLAGLVVLGQQDEPGALVAKVACANPFGACPHRGQPSNKVHAYVPQRKRDLPPRGRQA